MNNFTAEEVEEKVLSLLNKNDAISFEELAQKTNMTGSEEKKELSQIISKLQDEFKVSSARKGRERTEYGSKGKFESNRNKKNKKNHNEKYTLFNDRSVRIGLLDVKRRDDGSVYGFVQEEGSEKNKGGILVNDLNGAINGDTVAVQLVRKKGREERERGFVLKVIQTKSLDRLIGEVLIDAYGKMTVELDDKKMDFSLNINEKPHNVEAGYKVLVKANREVEKSKYGEFDGEIVKVIGDKKAPGVDLLSIAYEHEASVDFPNEVLEQVKRIPTEVLEQDMSDRKDLRNEMIFTIDGDDTKDIDDAVSIKKLENGNYSIGIHIADVTHYVTVGSPLDKEAYKRGTSIYMIDTVIPMLPPELSNGICSLNPGVDRLALSCEIEMDKNGVFIDHNIFASVINSKKQMTYDKVNQILIDNVIPEGYEDYEETIRILNEAALILKKVKMDQGELEFASNEIKFKIDENNIPVEITLREQKDGEKLIEDLMIAANETVATAMDTLSYPSIYRVHESPDPEKVMEIVMIADALGIEIPHKNEEFGAYPKAFQKLIGHIKTDPKVYQLLSELLVRTQRKAKYSTRNMGHFGLALKKYTHFTSPIRRYPDLQLHRQVKRAIVNVTDTSYSTQTITEAEKNLPVICDYTSLREREAEKCEREADDMKTAEMMSYHIGEEFDGIVTSVTPDALFVRLTNNAEGRMHISELNDDTYPYDETLYRFVGKNTGKIYTYGSELAVMVKNAVKETRRVDFVLAEEKEEGSMQKVLK